MKNQVTSSTYFVQPPVRPSLIMSRITPIDPRSPCLRIIYRVFIKYCVFSKILKYSGLLPFSVFPRCQCVYTRQVGRTPALQQNWQSSENSQNFKENHNI